MKIEGNPWTSSVYSNPIPETFFVPKFDQRSCIKSNEIMSLISLLYFNILPYFHVYITEGKKVAKASGSQSPSKSFDRTDDM